MVPEQRRGESRSTAPRRRRARKGLGQQGRKKRRAPGLIGLGVVLVLLYFAGRACMSWAEESSSSTIPEDVTYTVIDANVIPGMKRSLDIRLNRRVSEEVLRSIALELKGKDPKDYERTFISYYLPGQSVGAGGWATTQFNPDLEVLILEPTAEQAKSLDRGRNDPSREVLGAWLWESPTKVWINLYRQGGKLYMEQKHSDGSSSNLEVVEEVLQSGHRLEERGGSSLGEYFLIDLLGNLQIRDREGLIATAKKIE